MTPGKLTLILGGARSGKSAFAVQLAGRLGNEVVYVATAQAGDEEMAARIAAHRAGRPPPWRTLEVPRGVGSAISAALEAQPADVVVVDCLTLLANNVIAPLSEPATSMNQAASQEQMATAAEIALSAEVDGLLAASGASSAHWLVISNEVGLGLVPPYPLGRIYRDMLGRANQRLAAAADNVYFMVAGLPLVVKGQLITPG